MGMSMKGSVEFEINTWQTKSKPWTIRFINGSKEDILYDVILALKVGIYESMRNVWYNGVYSDHYCGGFPPRYWRVKMEWQETRNFVLINIHADGGSVWHTLISIIYDKVCKEVDVYVENLCDALTLLNELDDVLPLLLP